MTRRRMVGLLALAALLVAALATRGFGLFSRPDPALTLYGNVDIRQVDLGFRLPGRIAMLGAEEGARVSKGQLLGQLDRQTFRDSLGAAEANLALAEAELAKRRAGNREQDIAQAAALLAERQSAVTRLAAEVERRTALAPSGAVSRAQLEASRADLAAAEARARAAADALALQRAGSRSEDIAAAIAQRDAAAAERNRARTDLADASLTAPDAGIILTRAREPGAIVQGGETVFTLTIDRPLRIRAYVAEPDLGRIRPGMAVEVTADGNPRTYHGSIGFISPTAEFTPKTVQTESLRADLVYRLRVYISDPDDALRQGQPVTVRVPAATSGAP